MKKILIFSSILFLSIMVLLGFSEGVPELKNEPNEAIIVKKDNKNKDFSTIEKKLDEKVENLNSKKKVKVYGEKNKEIILGIHESESATQIKGEKMEMKNIKKAIPNYNAKAGDISPERQIYVVSSEIENFEFPRKNLTAKKAKVYTVYDLETSEVLLEGFTVIEK